MASRKGALVLAQILAQSASGDVSAAIVTDRAHPRGDFRKSLFQGGKRARQRHERRHSAAEACRGITARVVPRNRFANCDLILSSGDRAKIDNHRSQIQNPNSKMRLPRGVTVTQRPLEALFLVRIQAG